MKDSFGAPVEKGEKAGEIVYMLEGEEIAGYDIVTLGSVEDIILTSKCQQQNDEKEQK